MGAQQHRLYFALGGNLGDSHVIFDQAICVLAKKMTIEKLSSRIATQAMYNTQQPDFLNMVGKAITDLTPRQILDYFKQIEVDFGRDLSAKRYSERALDIDLLYYDDRISTQDVLLPHPLLHERHFVLDPLSEIIDADFFDPLREKTVAMMQIELAEREELSEKIVGANG